MIEILSKSQGKTLGVRLTGKATDEDYEKIFVPALENLIKEHGKDQVSLLYGRGLPWVGTRRNVGRRQIRDQTQE